MRKKFLSAFMLGLLALGTAGTITSCKDYDGDISSLKNDLSTLNSNLTSQLNDLKSTLAAQKSELETKIASAKTELQAAIDQKADKTTVEALAARVSTLETELVTVKSRLDLVEADIATLKATVAEKADKTELEAAKTALETKIADAKSALQAAIDLKADKTVTDALQKSIEALENRVKALETSVKKLEDGKVDKTEFAEYKLQVAADISTINGEIETLKGAIEELKGVDADLAAKIATEIANRTTADEALAQALAEAVEAQGEVNDEVAQKIADLVVADGQLQEQITTLAGVVEALSNKEKLDIENLSSKLDALKASTIEALNALADQIADFKEQVAATYATKASVSELETNLKTLMQNADNAVKTALTTKINDEIALVNGDIDVLSFLVQKRLTSIVFLPSTYINGVEAITFNTLGYYDWSNDPKAWLADGPVANAKYVTSGDKEATVEYYLNPTGVDISSIDTLSFISNKATDIWGRADANKAPIAVVKDSWSIKDNKLTVKIEKVDSVYTVDASSFNYGNLINGPLTRADIYYSNPLFNDFTIVSLKATLDKSVLTDEEQKAGNDVNVYSDWARVMAFKTVPFIHDARAYDAANKQPLHAGYDGPTHFYYFSEIYNTSKVNTNSVAKSGVDAVYNWDDDHIALEVCYDKEYDLDTLVMICDNMGNKVEPAQYGFHFEFSNIKYVVKNEWATTDATDQSKYITLNGSKIKSRIVKEDKTNRDAIGKTPVIQVRLVDENGVVADVRYFRVKWTDVAPTVEKREVYSTEAAFACGEAYEFVIGEDYMNAEVYAKEGEKGMSQEEFHTMFNTFPMYLHSTYDGAVKQNWNDVIGQVIDLWSAQHSTQAHNFKVTFNPDKIDVKLTDKLYKDGGDTTLVAYFDFRNSTGSQIRVIPVNLKITFKDKKAGLGYNYIESYWKKAGGELKPENINKYVVVNPTLETSSLYGLNTTDQFKTCQIVYDLKKAYIKDGHTPSTINKLDSAYQQAVVVIDETRLDILPKAENTVKWEVKNEGDYSNLYYTYKKDGKEITEKAAHLNKTNGIIQLEEADADNKPGKAESQPTEGALLLVNYDAAEGQLAADTKNAIPVKVVAPVCNDYSVVIDQFLVRFEQPLTFTSAASSVEVKDVIPSTSGSNGSISAPISSAFTVKEAFGAFRNVTSNTLKSWYIVEDDNTAIHNANIIINQGKDGKIISGNDYSKWPKLSELTTEDNLPLYDLKLIYQQSGWTRVRVAQFQNLHGNSLTDTLTAKVPVSLDTKWRKGVSDYITVKICPNTTPGTTAAKGRK